MNSMREALDSIPSTKKEKQTQPQLMKSNTVQHALEGSINTEGTECFNKLKHKASH